MPLVITTPQIGPTVDPEAVKRRLGIEHNADDETVLEMIAEATQLIQDEVSIQLLDAVATLKLDQFPGANCPIEIWRPPVREIEEFTYVDADGEIQAIDPEDFQFDGDSQPARVVPAAGTYWPRSKCGVINSVSIRFRCGAASIDDVPAGANKLIHYLCGLWYENRLPVGTPPGEDVFYRRQLDLLRWI